MATTDQLRAWWASYRCDTSKMVRVGFPGPTQTWNLLVAAEARDAWSAFASVMSLEGYLFRESAGGTYNCRPIAGSTEYSLHAYGIAVDLNPSVNPYGKPLRTDIPQAFRTRVSTIVANGKRCFEWGGAWTTPDAMHFEIDVAPADIAKGVTYDGGTDEDDTMNAADFATRLSIEQVKAICNQKGEGGVWVISPTDPNRTAVTDYFVGLLNNPSSTDWVAFYQEVETEALVNAAIRKAGPAPSGGVQVPLTIELKGTAKP